MGETLLPLVDGVYHLMYFWPGFDSPAILVHVGCLGYRFFSSSHLNFLPILIRSISFLDYPEKIRILVKEITVIGLGEEVEKKIQNKEHDETNIKLVEEATNCIPLANEDGADFANAAFIFIPPVRQFIAIAGNSDSDEKGDWKYYATF